MQLPFPSFMPNSNWEAPKDFPDLSRAKKIGVDLETYDPSLLEKGPGGIRKEGFVTGFAIGVDDASWYFPVRHSGGNVPFEPVQRWLRHELSRPHQPKVAANGMYDREWLVASDVQTQGIWYDIQIAEALLDEELPTYKLDSLAFRYLGIGKDERLLNEAASLLGFTDAKKCMHYLEARHVAPYAMGDVEKTLKIFDLQVPKLEEQELWPIFEMESELTEVVFYMRQRGVRIDQDGIYKLIQSFKIQEADIYRQTQFDHFKGREINFMSNGDLEAICQQNKWDYPLTTAGNASFKGDWLEAQKHPFWTAVNRWREINKLRSTFLESSFLGLAHKGRLHAEFMQMKKDEGGTRSGRFACKNPNLQQVPSRMEEAKAIRTLFLPEEGQQWAKIDYSQQEYRLLVHFAMLMNMQGAKDAGQAYIDDEKADYHSIVAKMTGLNRTDAKNVNFACAYGAGVKKFALMTKKTIEEAERIYEQYHEAVPYVRQLSNDVAMRASRRGWIRTIGGRVLHFNFWEPNSFDSHLGTRPMALRYEAARQNWPNSVLKRAGTHKALNRLIQGSAADMTKLAMLIVWKRLKMVPLMQVHDELSYSVDDKETALKIKSIMENIMSLVVPVRADLSLGTTWGNGEKI